MRISHLGLGLTLAIVLGACADPPLPDATVYVQQDVVQAVPLTFAPNSTLLTAESEAALQVLRRDLPDTARLALTISGGLADARARQVGVELGRPVLFFPDALPGSANGIDRGQLTVVTRRLVASDCLAPGQPMTRGSWPGDDDRRGRTISPGCAAANALQQMAVNQEDLQHGRPLPPGAALPVARAIERYYARSELGASSTSQASPTPAAGNTGAAGAPAAPGAGSSGAGADLLQGPLTQAAPATTGN